MEFLSLAQKRYSARSYKHLPIEDDKLHLVLEAGRIAPSAVNLQPWIFIVIKDFENRKSISAAYRREWLLSAPVLIVICGDHSISWKRNDGKDHCDIDIAIAVDHMTLQAAELDLATCWVCNFDKIKCSEILNLPPFVEPVVILPIGYPADEKSMMRHTNERKELSSIVHFEKF